MPTYKLLAFFNKKTRQRELFISNIQRHLYNSSFTIKSKNETRIWFHAASMGEFEQAKPVIEYIKSLNSEIKIIVTFYSPSGYENQKNYTFADNIYYMPFDTISLAKEFIDFVNPDLVVFVRYDFWLNHLNYLKKLNIPRFLINASKPNSKFYQNSIIGKYIFRHLLEYFDTIFTMDMQSKLYFESILFSNTLIESADTRIDRIIEKVENSKQNQILNIAIFNNIPVLIAGSTWEIDEDQISNSIKELRKKGNKIHVVYVPHEPTEEHIKKLKIKLQNNCILLSELIEIADINKQSELIKNNDIIVDSIGKLLSLYSLADIAYVGGAFGVGVHSVTEPAGYGLAIITGNNFHNSIDAKNLYELGSLLNYNTQAQLIQILNNLLGNYKYNEELKNISKKYVYKSKGESKKVAEYLIKTISHK